MKNEVDKIGPCGTCGEVGCNDAEQQCEKSRRECGHHCNHIWTDDECCWCGVTFLPDDIDVWKIEPGVICDYLITDDAEVVKETIDEIVDDWMRSPVESGEDITIKITYLAMTRQEFDARVTE